VGIRRTGARRTVLLVGAEEVGPVYAGGLVPEGLC
jgi:hypothetical protein